MHIHTVYACIPSQPHSLADECLLQERIETERSKRRSAESEMQKISTALREAQCELEMKVSLLLDVLCTLSLKSVCACCVRLK